MANWVRTFLENNPDMAALPVVKRARRSIHFQQGASVVAHFTGKPIFDMTTMQPIDTALLVGGDGRYGASGIPVKIATDGTVGIEGQTYSHRTSRIGIYNTQNNAFSATATLSGGTVIDNVLRKETGYYRHDLILLEDGLREELILLQAPPGGTVNEWLVTETLFGTTQLWPNGPLNEFSLAGMRFPLPNAQDALLRRCFSTRRFARYSGGIQRLYTGIPLSWLATAQYPVVIDPDFNAGNADQVVYGQNATYATARLTSAGNIDDANLYCGQQLNAGTYYVYRFFLLFDTSSIGAVSTVTQVNLKMTPINKQTSTTWNVLIKKYDWSASNPIDAGNRETVFDGALAATEDDNIFQQADTMVDNTQYSSGNLATAWVSKTGTTYYAIMGSNDRDSTAPTTNDYQHFASSSHGTAGYRPVLTVVYGLSGRTNRLGLLGVA